MEILREFIGGYIVPFRLVVFGVGLVGLSIVFFFNDVGFIGVLTSFITVALLIASINIQINQYQKYVRIKGLGFVDTYGMKKSN